VRTNHYTRSGRRWALGAELVYAPIAAELARVTRLGGAVLAAVFSTGSRSQARDRIDAIALAAGWQAPGWYAELKSTAAPLLGSRAGMASAVQQAGLADERRVDVGFTAPGQLVRYRFGHAVFAGWLDAIGTARAGLGRGCSGLSSSGAWGDRHRRVRSVRSGLAPRRCCPG
jgi:hypothetical protein